MMESCVWVRGEEIGHGSFGSVSKATVTSAINDIAAASTSGFTDDQIPSLIMAVKSCDASVSDSLKEEKRIIDAIGLCLQILRCFGDTFSPENGQSFYNLFLEFPSKGTLADELHHQNGLGLAEPDVRRHTRAVLQGLSFIHSKGFVHCDIKPQNILIFSDGEEKISDFWLSKKKEAKIAKYKLRWTPLYMAPESVKASEYELPCEIWSLGSKSNMWKLLVRIARGDEILENPEELFEEGRDFLRKCFVKDPMARWTAQMLLNHPFVARSDHNDDAIPLKKDEADGVGATGMASMLLSPRSRFRFGDFLLSSEPHDE